MEILVISNIKERQLRKGWKLEKTVWILKKISLKLKNLTSIGNINGAFNIPTERISKGNLPLTNRTMKILKRKHSKSNEPASELLLQGLTQPVRSIIYESAD